MPDVKYTVTSSSASVGTRTVWVGSSGGAIADYEAALTGGAGGEVWIVRLYAHNHTPVDPVIAVMPVTTLVKVEQASDQTEDSSADAEFFRIL